MGLSSAYYARRAGHDVVVLEQGDFGDNCSHGNMGYICPSHFVPLASPGKVRDGLRWMFNAQSPFYIHPSFNPDLIEWGWKFMRIANVDHVERSAVPLRDIGLLSQNEYRQWSAQPEFQFTLHDKGLLEIFRSEAGEHHAKELSQKGNDLGLEMSVVDLDGLRELEPETRFNARGAIYFKCDGHVYPDHVVRGLRNVVSAAGVQLLANQHVARLERHQNAITHVVTDKSTFDADHVVIAAGSWSKKLAKSVGVHFPLMPGRGYSLTVKNGQFQMQHPAVLVESRVALTPLNATTMRFGGTMEVVPIGTPPRYKRMQGIVNGVNDYFPEAHLKMPRQEDIWCGYRPCSADGLPYIGRTRKYPNLLIATGHSMIGMSLGAGTGKLIAELIDEKTPSIDIEAFAVERFC